MTAAIAERTLRERVIECCGTQTEGLLTLYADSDADEEDAAISRAAAEARIGATADEISREPVAMSGPDGDGYWTNPNHGNEWARERRLDMGV